METTAGTKLRIAIVGLGAIGTTFASHLSRAGHAVTAVARGSRLEQLRRDGGAIRVEGETETAAVDVAPAGLDTEAAYDLVLVVVLAHQLAPLVPALKATRAAKIMLMFNTYSKLEDLREEIGAAPARFCFGFPAILAKLVDGVLVRKLYPGMASIVSEGPYDSVFTAAGITTAVEPRMQSWLRTHAALVVPLMFLGQLTKRENRSVAYSDAWTAALAMHECFALARRVGEEIVPSGIAVLSWTPTFALAGMLWALGRTGEFKEVQLVGPAEPEALLKEMIAASGGDEGALKALLSLRSP